MPNITRPASILLLLAITLLMNGCGQSQSQVEHLQSQVREIKDQIEAAQYKISSAKDEIQAAKLALSEIQDKTSRRNVLGIGDDANDGESALNSSESD